MRTMREDGWIHEVLDFWFRQVEPAKWFRRDDELDEIIKRRFAALYEAVRGAQPQDHRSPQAALAAVIALDQFPRNMFRGSPRAYATDALALETSANAIDRGFDRQLETRQRSFLYMPWQHSEDLEAQRRSVALFTELGDAVAIDYARQHQEVIDRFGRFPHRNRILGRESTPDETEFLKTHPGF